jgi:hypothetical protein
LGEGVGLGSFDLVITEFETHAAGVYSERTPKSALKNAGYFKREILVIPRNIAFTFDHLLDRTIWLAIVLAAAIS